MDKKRTVVIIATLDTRAPAAQYLRDEIAAWGLRTLLIDPGILGTPGIPADINRWQVAEAAGTPLDSLIASREVQTCIAVQSEGLCRILSRLHAEKKLDGILALGGRLGTAIGMAAMRALPLGVPKLMLSSATGESGSSAYFDAKDIYMVPSITDIRQVNAISRPILINAANAIAGMVMRSKAPFQDDKPAIAITQIDMTRPCVKRLGSLLEPQGVQLVPFYAGRAGEVALEELIDSGKFVGLIDLSPHEVIGHRQSGIGRAAERFRCLSHRSLPAVVSVGGCDYVSFDSAQSTPEEMKNRLCIQIDAHTTVLQPAIEEMEAAARYLAVQVNRALGPTMFVVPSVGFSEANQPGREFYFPQGNRAVIAVLRSDLRPEVPLVVIDAHINQPVFADIIGACMARLLAGEPPDSVAARYHLS